MVLIVVLSGCTQSTGQASLSSTQTKTDCPYECCKNLSQYFGKVCALGAECVDNKCVDEGTPTEGGTSPPTGEGTAPPTPPTGEAIYKLGEKFSIGELSYTLNGIDQINFLGNEYMYQETEGMYYLVEFKIENNGNTEKTLVPSQDFAIIDSQGREYASSATLSIYAATTGFEMFKAVEEIPAGLSRTGSVVFEAPVGITGKIKVKPDLFSKEAYVEFKP